MFKKPHVYLTGWYLYNDAIVSKANWESVQTLTTCVPEAAAYVLVYEKLNGPLRSDGAGSCISPALRAAIDLDNASFGHIVARAAVTTPPRRTYTSFTASSRTGRGSSRYPGGGAATPPWKPVEVCVANSFLFSTCYCITSTSYHQHLIIHDNIHMRAFPLPLPVSPSLARVITYFNPINTLRTQAKLVAGATQKTPTAAATSDEVFGTTTFFIYIYLSVTLPSPMWVTDNICMHYGSHVSQVMFS